MKVIRSFFLGGACGLALAMAIAVGLYLSPIRKGLYLDWDPEIADLRSRMDQIRERVVTRELGLAEAGLDASPPRGARVIDSLKSAQAGAWKEYRHWRNRLGELSRAHDEPKPSEFPSWAYSLRYGLSPLAAFLFLAPGCFLAYRAARRPRPSRSAKAPSRPAPAAAGAPASAAEALSSFESAVKKVALIAAPAAPAKPAKPAKPANATTPAAPKRPAPPQIPEERLPPAARPSAFRPLSNEDLAQEASPYDVESGNAFQSDNAFRVPETESLPLTEAGEVRPEGMDTQIINLGPGGWGEARPAAEEPPDPPRSEAARGLSMEDEDGEDLPEEPPSGAFMPPTTEVERVERRKAEVLKLARKGMTSSEISRRLRISQDQVEIIIRMRREKG